MNRTPAGSALDVIVIMEALRKRRKQVGMIQEQLAEKIGMSVKSVTDWETARRTPTLDTLAAMARVLGMRITVEELPQEDQE